MHVRIIMHVYMSDTHGQARAVHIQGTTIQLTRIQGPIIQTYEGPQGPGTMLLKSGTVPEIRGPLRPMDRATSILASLIQVRHHNLSHTVQAGES